jgi:hypothetical protein
MLVGTERLFSVGPGSNPYKSVERLNCMKWPNNPLVSNYWQKMDFTQPTSPIPTCDTLTSFSVKHCGSYFTRVNAFTHPSTTTFGVVIPRMLGTHAPLCCLASFYLINLIDTTRISLFALLFIFMLSPFGHPFLAHPPVVVALLGTLAVLFRIHLLRK